jgi:hypothetical protein
VSGWERYWLVWFLVSASSFLTVEVYGLVTDRTRTLSYAVWHLERFKAKQPIDQWAAGHFLFTFLFLLIAIWLVGHFGWGWWR